MIRLPYLAGLVCGMSIGASAVVGLFLEAGLSFPPDRDWHHIMWAMFVAGCTVGLVQIGRWQVLVDVVILMVGTAIASQFLFPAVGSDEAFDRTRIWWLIVGPIAAGSNTFFLRRLILKDGAGWGQWILVAQLAIVSVALMLNYGTLAGAAIGVLSMTIVLAAAMSFLHIFFTRRRREASGVQSESEMDLNQDDSVWIRLSWLQVAIAPLELAAILLTICVRTYSYGTIAGWVYIPLLFLPTVVCVIDFLIARNMHPEKRVLVVAGITTAITATVGIYMLATSAPPY
jgi:hypothetical protein